MGRYGVAELVERAKADLARRLGASVESITVVSVMAAEWPDTSLGCPEKGKVYASVVTPGHRIVLACGNARYEYRTDGHHIRMCSHEAR